MRHKVAGWKLGRTTSHRRSLLRNLATSLILEERIETTVPKAKALRPRVEKMITLGKRGDLAARRKAGAYLMTREAVNKLFDTIGPRFGDREGGFLRIVRAGWQKGDGAEKALSNCWAARNCRKKNARSVPRPVPSVPPKPRRRWKKRRLRRERGKLQKAARRKNSSKFMRSEGTGESL